MQGIINSNSPKRPEVILLPPAIFIPQVAKSLEKSNIAWGGQNMSAYREGAYTGQISGSMLAALGCRYVLLGHSECRQYGAEDDEQIMRKLRLAQQVGLTPILCLGESWEQYQSNETTTALIQQLEHYLNTEKTVFHNIVLAYEPIWAIGTVYSATPLQIQTVHQKLRTALTQHLSAELAQQIRILYGGNVNPENAHALFSMPDIDGGLVGRASLSADRFLEIYHAF
jgi:triosephosphate isomerase (TIM)